MSSARGIFRAERSQLEAVARGGARALQVEDVRCGGGPADLAGRELSAGRLRHARRRLWFTTTEGAVVVDPKRIRRNTLPPPVVVETVTADDKPFGNSGRVDLPAAAERLAIHYNGSACWCPARALQVPARGIRS